LKIQKESDILFPMESLEYFCKAILKIKIFNNSKTLKGLVFLFLFTAFLFPAFTEEAVGRLVYRDGDLEVYRKGEALDWAQIDLGMVLESYDLLETSKSSFAEVELTLPHTAGAFIKINENTAFYFDVKDLGSKKQTNFQILTGSMLFKVKQLTGSAEVIVRTESTTLGVRGTEFLVTTAVDGSLLVTCTEGLVSCTDQKGREFHAKPGIAVETLSEGISRSISLKAEEIDQYRESWLKTREEIFKTGAELFIKNYALRYLDSLPAFQRAYRNLIKHYPVLKNAGEDTQRFSQSTLIQIKSEVSPAIFEMRGILPSFEHLFYRLEELEGYHRSGFGKSLIKRNYSSDDFFIEFLRIKKQVKIEMAIVRHMFHLFVQLDKGMFGDSMMEDIFGTSPIAPIGPPSPGFGGF